ncbi:MAG: ATP-binding protein [Aestuariivita sp.]|nr:ATP-binding protein [Aestuariivita sp.]MCY4203249.1 ATP-binding protein [Aestuariivita sp.]
MMAYFKRSELKHFVEDGEKDHPPVFAGRRNIMEPILTTVRRTGERKRGIPGNTTVIQGAPGAGKSSVLRELTRFNTDLSEEGPKTLYISSVELEENFSDVLLAIGTLGQTKKSRLKALALKGARRFGGLALLDVAGLMEVNIQTVKALFREHEIRNIGALHKAFPASDWDTPVIVAVDEAQNLPPGRSTSQSNFLRTLHEAVTQLPLALVLAGLGDTQSVIRSMGLTRHQVTHRIGRFTLDEQAELTDRWTAHFGITIGDQRGRMDQLMAPTDGWPRHVHCAQQALAEALLAPGVDGHADRIPDWRDVHARSDQLRHSYYETQFSDAMVASCKLVGRVMVDVTRAFREGDGLTFGQVVDAVDRSNGHEPGSEWTLPEDMNARSYVTHLIHCGALEENPETWSLTCPIPSFQSYIGRRGGLDPATLE